MKGAIIGCSSSTKIDLSKYKTKTTVFPKVQELSTKLIFLCLYKLKIDKNYELDNKFLNCNEETYGDIIEEAFKRGIKPFTLKKEVLLPHPQQGYILQKTF